MNTALFFATLAGVFALLFLAAVALCGRMNDRRAEDRDIKISRRARDAALKEVVDESDTFDDQRDQAAICSAVWAVRRRETLRHATSGGAMTEE